MDLQSRIDILVRLGEYMQNGNKEFELVKENAQRENPWFTQEFISLAVSNIANNFLVRAKLEEWTAVYPISEYNTGKKVGIIMAGNIPLVGFHDLLSVFITGNKALVKTSSKDAVLIRHLVGQLCKWDSRVGEFISFAEMLKDCDAYIATGSNNSGRYFEYYFSRYPNIIRRNKTSVAILDGSETTGQLDKLADDMQLYFGLGCRNVTRLFVPKEYEFSKLLRALDKYGYFMDFHKYKHNYDYQLALLIMNNKFYMTNGSVLLCDNESMFAPVSQVHYSFYDNIDLLKLQLKESPDIQCIVGNNFVEFGTAQYPALQDYADNVDTMAFLCSLQ